MKDFMRDNLDELFIIGVVFITFLLVLCVPISIVEKDTKEECYEIYATDNVILKKCEKYFDKEVK